MPPFRSKTDCLTVKAKPNARKWVKERLKLHGDKFEVEEWEKSVPCWQGEMAVRLRSIKDEWDGWFPVMDIEIIDPS